MQVKLKLLKKVMSQLREGWLFVEGKRDKEAFLKLGFYDILTISGNLRISCEKVCESGPEQKVFVLTDFDRRGNELAKMAKEELEARSITADLTARKAFRYILNIRHFEDVKKAYDKLKEEVEKEH